jgi:hypothetical protein
MEHIDQARNLLESLKRRSRELAEIKEELCGASVDELEALYSEEFKVAMEMSDIFETLNLTLDRMEQGEDAAFIASRLRTQAEAIIGNHSEYEFKGDT